MGVNDTPLSQRERDELRGTVTAGAERMRRARARRIGWVSAAAAVVLVAGVVTGVVVGTMTPATPPVMTTSPTPTGTPSATPAPSGTPSATPTPVAATARSIFGGDCNGLIDAALVAEALDARMEVQPQRWQSPQHALAGGVECVWWDGESYMTPSLTVYAYPTPPDAVESALQCTAQGHFNSCRAAVIVNGVWVFASASAAGLAEEGMRTLVEALTRSTAAADRPRAAQPVRDGWSLPTCDELSAVALPEGTAATVGDWPAMGDEKESVRATIGRATMPYETLCAIDVQTTHGASGERYTTRASLEVVPGGGAYFDQIAASEGAEPIQIAGVPQAVLVRDNARWEGYAPALLVRDGVNAMIFRGNNGLEPRELAPFAAPYLAFLNAGLR